ncbi:P-II family nitrogen regulator [Prochlorothrix hollandica]|uniref:Nitrogen regulatory protein P-II n=1 Tax=Prochlorothrix hollandica PCC 9006 = CALU 1027 TaxID=317619 RepID=A0A0M2PXR6_PROHO|nr:P-II family nitrogen regulator [Prochlorothrix hollandica]KKI99176.1 nitrogen regulatory protein P-II [Prochlorothrix hollandica PCC 9006 = CALU 1027]
MNRITAVIRLSKLNDVKNALVRGGVLGMTITEVQGYGRQKGQTASYRGAKQAVEFQRKMRLEVMVTSEQTDTIVETIVKAGQTGEIGDGKIFVAPITQTIRIRTEEQGDDAL